MIAKSDYHREQFNGMAAPPELDDKLHSSDGMDIIELNDDGDVIGSDDSLGLGDLQESDSPVYVCCFCLDEFGSHDEVNNHQNVCQMKVLSSPQQKTNFSSSFKSVLTNNIRDGQAKPGSMASSPAIQSQQTPFPTVIHAVGTGTTTHCYSSSNANSFKNTFVSNSKSERSSERLKTRSQKRLDQIMEKHKSRLLMVKESKELKSVPKTGAWWCSQKKKKKQVPVSHPSRDFLKVDFTSVLGLAEKCSLKNNDSISKGTDIDLDCEITLVEGPLSKSPAPSSGQRNPLYSPRTKSLMSQLSREPEADIRRRVSLKFVEDEWADREALEEGRDPLSLSLLTMDLCSPLGQRIKKFVKGEGVLNIIKDPEQFCKTVGGMDGHSKLRFKSSDYRVTFKKKCKSSSFVHKYKFTKEQHIEFNKRVQTGLTARGRQLLRCMKPCKLVLKRMSEAEIKSYSERKITIPDKIVYDDDVCITQIDLPESIVAKERAREHIISHSHLHQHMAVGHSHSSSARSNHRSVNPHVPNIYRNRPGQTLPLPQPGGSQHHQRPLAPSNLTKGLSQSPYIQRPQQSNDFLPLGSQSSQKENPQVGKQQQPPYKSSVARSSDLLRNAMLGSAPPRNTSSPVSRRKQQLTAVRLDDFDSLNGQRTINGGVLNIHSHQAHAQIPNNCSSNYHESPSQNCPPVSQGSQLSSNSSHRHTSSNPNSQHAENNQHLHGSHQAFQQSPSQRLSNNNKDFVYNRSNSNNDPHAHQGHDCLKHNAKFQKPGSLASYMSSAAASKYRQSSRPHVKTTLPPDDDVLEVICIDDD